MWKNFKFKTKVSVLTIVYLVFTIITALGYHTMSNKIRDIGIQEASNSMLEGYKNELQDIIDVVAQSLSDSTKGLTNEKDIFDTYKMITENARFFPDKSGYFFIYKNGGTVVLNAASPEMNGKNFLDLKDINGKSIIQDLEKAANSGGDFVEYWWKKPGKGVLPKISYAQKIANSDHWIGTGVYIEDIQEREELIYNSINDYSKGFLIKLALLLVVIFLVIILPISIYLIKIMVPPLTDLTELANEYSLGQFDRDNSNIDIDRKDEIGQLSKALKLLGRSTSIILKRFEENS